GETLSESSRNNNNMLDDDDGAQTTCMIDFGKKMKTIMENFKNCTEKVKIKNSMIMINHIEKVKEFHNIFSEFIKDSLKFNDELIRIQNSLQENIKDFKGEISSDEKALISYTGGKYSGVFYRALIYAILGLAWLVDKFSEKQVFCEAVKKEKKMTAIKDQL